MEIETTEINKICILTMGLLGDVLMVTPVIREIKNLFNNAYIICIADKIGAEILLLNDDVDETRVINRSRKNKFAYFKDKISTQFFILNGGFDLIIDLYGGKSANRMMMLNFIKYKIGLIDGKPWSNKLPYNIVSHTGSINNPYHITHHSFQLMNFFGRDYNHDTKPTIKTTLFDDLDMLSYFNKFGYENIFLVSFGSGGIEKILDFDKQFEIINYLYEKYKFVAVIVSNPGQEYLQDSFIKKYMISGKIPFVKLKPLNLSKIASLMKLVKFVMLPDTGLYHIAVGIKVPILGIFTYTNPILVVPNDGIVSICFQEGDRKMNDFFYYGTNKIEIESLFLQVDRLLEKIHSDNMY